MKYKHKEIQNIPKNITVYESMYFVDVFKFLKYKSYRDEIVSHFQIRATN